MSDGFPTKAVEVIVDPGDGHNLQPGLIDLNRNSDTGRSASASQVELSSDHIRPSPSSGKENESIGRQSVHYDNDGGEMHRDGSGSGSLQVGSNPFPDVISQEEPSPQIKSEPYEDLLSAQAQKISISQDDERFSQNQPSKMLSHHPQAETNPMSEATTSQPSIPPPLPKNILESPMESSHNYLTTQPSSPPRPPTSQSTDKSVAPTPKRPIVPQSVVEEKRKETYAIRHIAWKPRTDSPLQRIPILVQNKNGPCPLLALVNAIVLRSNPPNASPVTKALESRETISLGLLIQVLLEELVNTTQNDLPDIEDLSSFLTMLHTGMNVNPCLLLNTDLLSDPVYFQQTPDLDLYSSFGIPLVHGWLAIPSSETAESLKRRHAEYHEDAELLQIEFDQFTERILGGEHLTITEEMDMADIERILQFTRVDNATQLSDFGLMHLRDTLEPGSISILFRNNHFSTLYKHPETCTLFTLISDAGFASRAEVVWESLDDVTGRQTNFYSGDFLQVGGNDGAPEPASGTRKAGTRPPPATSAGKNAGATNLEQEDADYAYALQLQEEEEARQQQQQQQQGNNARNSSDRAQQTQPQKERPPPPSYEESKFDRRLVADVARQQRANSVRRPPGQSAAPAARRASVPQRPQSSAPLRPTRMPERERDEHGCVMM